VSTSGENSNPMAAAWTRVVTGSARLLEQLARRATVTRLSGRLSMASSSSATTTQAGSRLQLRRHEIAEG
jgi:hypothetical protein